MKKLINAEKDLKKFNERVIQINTAQRDYMNADDDLKRVEGARYKDCHMGGTIASLIYPESEFESAKAIAIQKLTKIRESALLEFTKVINYQFK